MPAHTKVFSGNERKEAVLVFENLFINVLVESQPAILAFLAIMEHLKADGYELEEALKEFVSIRSEALRRLADNFEECYLLSLREKQKI